MSAPPLFAVAMALLGVAVSVPAISALLKRRKSGEGAKHEAPEEPKASGFMEPSLSSMDATLATTVFRKHGAVEFLHPTNGVFHSEIDLKCHPIKIHINSPVSRDIESHDLPIEISVGSGSISLVRFTDKGIELNERGIRGAELHGFVISSEPQNPEQMPDQLSRITGSFYRVTIIRCGLITENREDRQQWMMCGLSLTVSLSTSGPGPVGIKEIRMATHKNQPPCRPLLPIGDIPVPVLNDKDAHGSPMNYAFPVNPQIAYLFDGKMFLPSSLEMVIIDQHGAEHQIHLRGGETLPVLPSWLADIKPKAPEASTPDSSSQPPS